jgi:hypothetical protein
MKEHIPHNEIYPQASKPATGEDSVHEPVRHFMNDTFKENITVIDQWKAQNDMYRLVDNGAGPMELQIQQGGLWRPEGECYVHSALCQRIRFLSNAESSYGRKEGNDAK